MSARLTPAMKRWGVLGLAGCAILAVAFVVQGQVEEHSFSLGDAAVDFEGVLVPGDTRQISLEGLAARLDAALDRLARMEAAERERLRVSDSALDERIAALRRDLANADAETRRALETELARLQSGETGAPQSNQGTAAPAPVTVLAPAPTAGQEAPVREEAATGVAPGPATTEKTAPAAAAPAPRQDRETQPALAQPIYTARPLNARRDRGEETEEAYLERVFAAGETAASPRQGPTGQGSRAQVPAGPIRTISAEAPPRTRAEARPGGREVQLPAGAILTGVLLNGLDAPGGSQSAREPLPVLVRLKHEAILPSFFTADLSECFVLLAVHGDLSSERAMMRGEELSCIMADGTVVQEKLAAYAVGEDGKTGVRGRVVSKQGAFLANALIVGALQAASKAVSNSTEIAVGAGSSGLGGGLPGAISVGSGNALDRIAEWYLARADELFPVVEIDPGRRIDLVLTTGMTFRVDL